MPFAPDCLIRARVIHPVAGVPLENGALLISRGKVAGFGRWNDFRRNPGNLPVWDLGESVVFPGFVNAHCHLDYSDMAGQIPPPANFPDWVKIIMAFKSGWNYSDYALSWLRGARMLLNSGTTTVADIEAVPELLPEVLDATPLRVFSFAELTCVKTKRLPNEIVKEALGRIADLREFKSRLGLSPHAPYSTVPELLTLSARASTKHRLPVAIHVGESKEEFEMFAQKRGIMFDWMRKSGRPMTDCDGRSPVEHVQLAGLLRKRTLLVHVNYVKESDPALIGKHGASVVHCPRSHVYFNHRAFPYAALRKAGVNLCLGTDSLATTRKKGRQIPQLNMFKEMQAFLQDFPEVNPQEVLSMSTAAGAKALGRKRDLGHLHAGARADLASIPFKGSLKEAANAVVQYTGSVECVMLDGNWIIAPGAEPQPLATIQ